MAADLTVDKIVLLQALFRGFLARKKLVEVRREFEEVLYELENGTNFVCWKREALGLPLITSDPKVLKTENEQNNSGINGERDNELKQTDSAKKGLIFGAKLTHTKDPETRVIPEHRKHVEGNGDEGRLLENLTPVASNTESSNSVKETFVFKSTKEVETEVNSIHGEQDDGEMREEDEQPRPTSEVSDSESFNYQGFGLQSRTTSMQGHKPGVETTFSKEQNPEKHNFFIPNGEITSQCDSPDKRFPREVAESPLPLNSTFKHGSQDEREMWRSFGQSDSASEASLQACVPGEPHLREQAILSDTWLTDRSFDTVLDEESTKEIPTDPVKLRQLRDHIGMELLWTEQAIQSRKKYLGLRKGLVQTKQDDSAVHCD